MVDEPRCGKCGSIIRNYKCPHCDFGLPVDTADAVDASGNNEPLLEGESIHSKCGHRIRFGKCEHCDF